MKKTNSKKIVIFIITVLIIATLIVVGIMLFTEYNGANNNKVNSKPTNNEKQTNKQNSTVPIYRKSKKYINIGDDVSKLKLGKDYVTNKSDLIKLNKAASILYLKHDTENNIITNTYVCFNVTQDMKKDYSEITVGEYCLEAKFDNTIYENNKKTINQAFGSKNCKEEEYTDINEKDYTCSNTPYAIVINDKRYLNITFISADDKGVDESCYVVYDGISYCSK